MGLFSAIFGSKTERVSFSKLQKRGNLEHEKEFQCSDIEKNGNRVLSIVQCNDEIIITYRILSEVEEKEDAFVLIKSRVISKKGIRCPEPKIKAVYFKEKNQIEIGDIDIFGANQNRGYGSKLMNELFGIAEIQNVEKITGWISDVDWDHIDRLEHFYNNHGFSVVLNRSERTGDISWERE